MNKAEAMSWASKIEAIAAPSVRARWLRLMRPTRIGRDQESPAVAQANSGHLDAGRRSINHEILVDPVELLGLAVAAEAAEF